MIRKIIVYFLFVLLFVAEKPVFMFYHWDLYGQYSFVQWLAVIWNGLPHDLTVAGYFSSIPFLLSLVHVWVRGRWHMHVMRWYLRLVLIPLLLFFFVDLELYTHWGFRLDATPLIYLTDNPGDAIAQAPMWALIVLLFLLAAVWWILQCIFCSFFPVCKRHGVSLRPVIPLRERLVQSVVCIFFCALLILPIRGGVTVSTMNVGRVYFSSDMKLNHAAVNPAFSFLSSIFRHEDFSRQYRFMTDAEAAAAVQELAAMPKRNPAFAAIGSDTIDSEDLALSAVSLPITGDSLTAAVPDTVPTGTLLSTDRPNVILILLESFSGAACVPLYADADPEIMPSVNRFYDEGIGFMNFYANSFRTDRGVAAVLASYPGQPTNSIMKDPAKLQNLQYLSGRMADYGYDLEFIHGGDADFTNMRGFLMAGKMEKIVADVDFPIGDRLSKWGVPDHKTFEYLYDRIVEQAAAQTSDRISGASGDAARPFMKVFLTLSSHEPFDVPFCRFSDRYLNSVAYTDSCLGSFVDRLKDTPYWENLLVIGLPDHCYANFPAGIMTHEPLRYHIPMFWVGGAVRTPRRVEAMGSQVDLAATLLAQLGMNHQDFNFSKDLMSDTLPHYAFYAWPDGFGFLTDSISYIQDNADDGHPLSGSDDPAGRARRWGKAYLQGLYDDLSRR